MTRQVNRTHMADIAFLDEIFGSMKKAGINKSEARGGFNVLFRNYPDTTEHNFLWMPSIAMMEEEANTHIVDVFERLTEEYSEREISDAIDRNWGQTGRDGKIADLSNAMPILKMPAYRHPGKGLILDIVDGLVKVVQYDRGLYAQCAFDKWKYFLPVEKGDINHLYKRIWKHLDISHSAETLDPTEAPKTQTGI